MRLSDMKMYQFYTGKNYNDKFIQMGNYIIQLIQPIIQQLKKRVNIVFQMEFIKLLRSAVDELRANWDLGKRHRATVSELEKLKDSLRMLAYKFMSEIRQRS